MCTVSEVVLLKRRMRIVTVESIDGEGRVQALVASLPDPLLTEEATVTMKQAKRNHC